MRRRPIRTPLATLLLALTNVYATALPQDSDQPIEVRANEAQSDPDGTSVLRGEVQIDQGTLRLNAELVTITSRDGHPSRIVAAGTSAAPVRFRQRLIPDAPFATGRATHVEYAVSDEHLLLEGDAFLAVDGREFAGDQIRWNVRDGRVSARAEADQGVTMKWTPTTASPAFANPARKGAADTVGTSLGGEAGATKEE